jgi:hypothetical protein
MGVNDKVAINLINGKCRLKKFDKEKTKDIIERFKMMCKDERVLKWKGRHVLQGEAEQYVNEMNQIQKEYVPEICDVED